MKTPLLILVILLGLQEPCLAFWGFGKNTPKQQLVLNEDVLINSKYQSKDGIFELKLAIHIPTDRNEIMVTSLDDELNPIQITNINWIVEQRPNEKITHKLFNPRFIKPYKSESKVNKAYENYTIDFNPDKAYDRVTDDKHIMNRSFLFNGTEIFGDKTQKVAHFLELNFSNSMKKSIRIEEKIYQLPLEIMQQDPPRNVGITTKEYPLGKYEEIQAGNKSLEVQQDIEAAHQEIMDFGSGGYSPLEYKVLPEAGIPADDNADFYTDTSDFGQQLDTNLLDLDSDDDMGL